MQTVIGGPRRQKDKISRGKHITILLNYTPPCAIHMYLGSKLLFALMDPYCSLVVGYIVLTTVESSPEQSECQQEEV